MENEQHALMTLVLTKGIGPQISRLLISYCGSAHAVFKTKHAQLLKIPGIADKTARLLNQPDIKIRAEKQINLIEKAGIYTLNYMDNDFPKRLLKINSAPLLLFIKGKVNFNALPAISVVGTRTPTNYGKNICKQFIQELKAYQPTIYSGLAYGIDTIAHKEALNQNVNTVSVLAHGLDIIYPSSNKSLASKIQQEGALLSEYPIGTKPLRENFPARNRLIAGLCDLLIVIESAKSGGSMITAEFANQYSKDVFAFPGRVTDQKSQGCNFLIKTHKAHLLESIKDIEYICRWDIASQKPIQTSLFVELTEDESKIIELLKLHPDGLHIDALLYKLPFSLPNLFTILLQLEFKNIISTLPGKHYKALIN